MGKNIFIKLFIASVVTLFFSNLSADQIHLKDGSVINGKIIQVTPKTIEYDPEGNRVFDIVPRDQAVKIVYDDGTGVDLAPQSTFTGPAAPADSSAQKNTVIEMGPSRTAGLESGPGNFLAAEWGWNGYVGLGARYEFSVTESISLNLGCGLSLWGFRMGGGGRYYFSEYPFGSAIGAGAYYSTGLKDVEVEVETTDAAGNKTKEDLEIDYKPVTIINLTYLYSWQIFTDNKVYIEAGICFRTKDPEKNYCIKDPNDPAREITLSEDDRDTLEAIQPGGLILAIGIAF